MGQNGSTWVKLDPNGSEWVRRVQMGPHGSKWISSESGLSKSSFIGWIRINHEDHITVHFPQFTAFNQISKFRTMCHHWQRTFHLWVEFVTWFLAMIEYWSQYTLSFIKGLEMWNTHNCCQKSFYFDKKNHLEVSENIWNVEQTFGNWSHVASSIKSLDIWHWCLK